MSNTVRVAMMFPAELKDQLQELAGPRNMTTWVLNAIYDKLEKKAEGALDPAEAKRIDDQLNEARQLAQAFADTIAASDDDPNPQRVLQSRDLPDWLDQEQWPQHLKSQARPTPVVEVGEPKEDWVDDPNLGAEETKEKFEALKPEPTIGPPAGGNSDDFLARVQAKAAELGLVTASSLPKPPAKTPEPEPEPEQPVAMEPAPLSQIKDPNACSSCGNDLVDGECWWCA